MSEAARAAVTGVLILASCIWVGGYLLMPVVARAARRSLEPQQRIAFFRSLGRSYVMVGTPALMVALGTGAALLFGRAWDGVLIATLVVAIVLLVALAVGIVQARQMTRLRAAAVAAPEDREAARRVERGARWAALLRAALGVLSLALIALGSLLAV